MAGRGARGVAVSQPAAGRSPPTARQPLTPRRLGPCPRPTRKRSSPRQARTRRRSAGGGRDRRRPQRARAAAGADQEGAQAAQPVRRRGLSADAAPVVQASGPGFVADPGTIQSVGQLPVLTARLDQLAQALGVVVYGISGYRTPAHSVAVGGFADDPHTKGEAEDIGVNSLLRSSAARSPRPSSPDTGSIGRLTPPTTRTTPRSTTSSSSRRAARCRWRSPPPASTRTRAASSGPGGAPGATRGRAWITAFRSVGRGPICRLLPAWVCSPPPTPARRSSRSSSGPSSPTSPARSTAVPARTTGRSASSAITSSCSVATPRPISSTTPCGPTAPSSTRTTAPPWPRRSIGLCRWERPMRSSTGSCTPTGPCGGSPNAAARSWGSPASGYGWTAFCSTSPSRCWPSRTATAPRPRCASRLSSTATRRCTIRSPSCPTVSCSRIASDR